MNQMMKTVVKVCAVIAAAAVLVGVNGEFCLVQRGKKVMVKEKFALVLENSHAQQLMTTDLIESENAKVQSLEKAQIL